MLSRLSFHICFFLLLACSMTLGFPRGAPPFACSDLDPKNGHGSSTAKGPAPYQVTFSKSQYKPGESIEVTLSGTGGAQFKGFIIIAQRKGNSKFDPLGNFLVENDDRIQITCNTTIGNGLTHTSPDVKSSIKFQWKAPPNDAGDIVFRYSVVRGGAPDNSSNPRDFFAQLESAPLKRPSNMVGKFAKDSRCGTKMGCYSNCIDDVCDWQIMFAPENDNVRLDLKSTFSTDSRYVAVGFSEKAAMFPSSVISCLVLTGNVSVVASHNPGYSNSPLQDPMEGISNVTATYKDGVLHCNFLREKVSSNALLYNLTDPWHIITARGTVNKDGSLAYHGNKDRSVTRNMVSIGNVTFDMTFPSSRVVTTPTPSTTITTRPSMVGKFAKDSRCGTKMGCYSNCVDDVCDWQIMFSPENDNVRFDLKSTFSTDSRYVAIGFSEKAAMFPASVISCLVLTGKVSVVASHNPGYSNSPLQDIKEGISNVTASYKDGVLHCNFLREKVSSNALIFNLTDPWHIITARGTVNKDGSLAYHGQNDRFLTSTKVSVGNVTFDMTFKSTRVVTTPTPKTAITTKPSAVGKFAKDSRCGTKMGCYSNCVDDVCDWQIMFAPEKDHVRFDLKSTFSTDSRYVAIGFSEQAAMFPASVISCLVSTGKVSVVASHNPGYSNSPLQNPIEAISNVTASYKDGVLHCNFLREKVSSNALIFNLTNPWYLITARGSAEKGGRLEQHMTSDRFKTAMKVRVENVTLDINFPSTRTSTTTPNKSTPPTPTSRFKKNPNCGKTQGCYSDCDDGTCSLLLSWQKKGQYIAITMTTVASGSDNKWIALGFSKEKKMGDASVVECTAYNGKVDAFASFNKGTSNSRLSPDPKQGISKVQGSFKDGILTCSFMRVISSTNENNADIFNLNQKWFLVTARGDVGPDGGKIPHSLRNCFLTSSRLSFEDPSVDISMEEPSFTKVKIHACFMIIAWIFLASIGIATARFCKPIFPDSLVCGVKVWFLIHRGAMVLTFCFGVAAFIIIFVEVGGYSEISGEQFKKAHPIFGIIVTSLLVINPLMSMLRCKPDDPKRPLFNWAHFTVGIAAHVLSAVTIAMGMYLPKAQVDGDETLIVIVCYGCWQVIFFAVMTKLDEMTTPEKADSKSPVSRGGDRRLSLSDSISMTRKASHETGFSKLEDVAYDETKEINSSAKVTYFKVKTAKAGMMVLHVIVLLFVTCYLIYNVVDTVDKDTS